jgi:hypothetical protein
MSGKKGSVMGHLRFWRRFTIFPGVQLNISKSGISFSFGPRGAKFTVGPKGTRGTVGLSGTGLFYTKTKPKRNKYSNWFKKLISIFS